jgi:hypothetical protein
MKAKSHPNVLRIFDVIVLPPQNLLIVFEHVEGFSLDKYVSNKNSQNLVPVPWGKNEFLKIFKNILEGVHYIHTTLQRYHLDLKPANVMWDTVNKKAIIIDVDDMGTKKQIDDEYPATTVKYAPVQDYDSAVETMTFDELYKKYDEATVGELMCEILLEIVKNQLPSDYPTRTVAHKKKMKKKHMVFFQMKLQLGFENEYHKWIPNLNECKEINRWSKGLQGFTDQTIKEIQYLFDGLLAENSSKRMNVNEALLALGNIK